VPEERFRVERAQIDANELAKSVRAVPDQVDGEVRGVRLFGIRPKSLPARVGLQNGDVVLRVNDLGVADPEAALEAYEKLRQATTLRVLIDRHGERRALVIDLVD
jgi:general secretion pathway protein C